MPNDNLNYRLAILYMLKKVDFPLTTAHFTEFFVDRSYTDFLTLQQTLSEMLESNFLTKEVVHNSSQYSITPDGEEALEMFQARIPDGMMDDVLDFFMENEIKLRNDVEVYADYIPASENEFIVDCEVKEKNSTVLSLKLNVATKEMAIAVCDNWKDLSSDVYSYLINTLVLNNDK
ncbi:MAG: DUF4364 family protein [Lachnospiraceae bacterium]|nr:DUF4364 family protein [Lachnospiraceae bacterium]